MKRNIFFIIVAAVFLLSGCHKEDEDEKQEQQQVNYLAQYDYNCSIQVINYTNKTIELKAAYLGYPAIKINSGIKYIFKGTAEVFLNSVCCAKDEPNIKDGDIYIWLIANNKSLTQITMNKQKPALKVTITEQGENFILDILQ